MEKESPLNNNFADTVKDSFADLLKILRLVVFLFPVIGPLFIFFFCWLFGSVVKGFVYLAYLFSAIIFRLLIAYPLYTQQDEFMCGFGAYVLFFSIGYCCYPMLYNADAVNPTVICACTLMTALYIYVTALECPVNASASINWCFGVAYGVLIAYLMSLGGASSYLFLTELSTRQYCSMPSSQKFKCSVYQGGQLITTYNK